MSSSYFTFLNFKKNIMRRIDCVLYKTHTELVHKERQHRDGSRENVDHVRKLLIVITSGLMTDPLSLDEDDDDEISPLIKIATDVGLRMPFALNERLVSTLRLALLSQITKFVEQRLNANNTTFWGSLPNLKIKTFASLVKKKTVKLVYEKVLVINADRELFCRLVIAAKSRVINLKMSLATSCQQSL